MKLIRSILVLLLAGNSSAVEVDFTNDVAPILGKYCVGCHSGDDAESDLRLDSFDGLLAGGENGPLINREDLDKSSLLAHVAGTKEPVMPPEDEPQPTKAEVATLATWITEGAKQPRKPTEGPNFDGLPPSAAPSPVTAIARRPNSERIVIIANSDVLGVEIRSKEGHIVPLAADVRAPKPFRFVLSNTKSSVTLGTVGGAAKIRGELALPIGYSGANPAEDLTVIGGALKGGPQPMNYRISADIAVATFGRVDLLSGLSAQPEHTLNTPGKVNSLCFSRDGSQLLAATGVAGFHGKAILWNADSGDVVQEFDGHADSIYSAQLSPDGVVVATGSYDRTIILWDVASGEALRTLRGHNGAVYDLEFSPDGSILASASADATVKIWNVETGERLDTLGQPLKEQYSVDISPDGRYVIAGGEDNRIRMWRLVSIKQPQINPIVHARFAHEGAIQHVLFANDGQFVVSSSADRSLKVWKADGLELAGSYALPDNSSQALAVAPWGDSAAIGRTDGTIDSLQLATNAPRANAIEARRTSLSVRDQPSTGYEEIEPNNGPQTAMGINVPASIEGTIYTSSPAVVDEDVFRFSAQAGEEWIIEVRAARDDSPLDSFVSVLEKDGTPVQRVQLQATRDSYFTFRGKDSNGTGDFRVHNWEEMRLNQLLYCGGEVVKLYHYPRGPDSGFNVYPNYGKRRGYFDTTPMAHALHAPCYIVEPHAPGTPLAPNGLPVFTLNYENDDDSQRRWGKDSRLTFVAPHEGDFLVALRDVRGSEGEDFKYKLEIRPPRHNFKVEVTGQDPKVSPGAGKKFGIEVERIDGFDGPIDVAVKNLPSGFSVAGPLQIQAGHDRLWATLQADANAVTPTKPESDRVEIVASATINGRRVSHKVGSLGAIEVAENAKLLVELAPDHEPSRGEAKLPVIELPAGSTTTATIRIVRNDHEGRVGFGSEDGAVNAPHGVYVDNIGLNGVLIVEGQTERQFFITAESWVKPVERVIFVEAGDADKPTSNPVILRILPGEQPGPMEQVSR